MKSSEEMLRQLISEFEQKLCRDLVEAEVELLKSVVYKLSAQVN
ncbi:hypothetical protein JOC54_000488 [Alkalihalobacillus xiaoxiensis]|uniref:Transposase n=1 Tax=Shouchella xiaoxiensis TaxID=766895 RepID=A0ABS2SP03_9BACI|nr:hypothetical protein [Shouchella xiaoxiensis]MBM7837257.1 hypothetical protein [Shouchella xiaoxiensis]